MRVLMRKVMELGSHTEDLEEAENLLRTMSFALMSLTRAVKTQCLLSSASDDFAALFDQALREVNDEWALTRQSHLTPCA